MGKTIIENVEGYLWWSNEEKPQVIENKTDQGQESVVECGDREEPQVIENGTVTLPDADANPFVVEGQLYDSTSGVSYSIKYVDGEYIIKKYTVTAEDKENQNQEKKEYLSNRMGGRWLEFLRYWEPIPRPRDGQDDANDPAAESNCPVAELNGPAADWPVLTQTKNVFIGFKKKEDSLC